MPPRAYFKGFIRLSLVSVPVKAFTANDTSGEVRLNQLHAECHSRIKYQKTCPTHGEVSNDEIVSGYEYAKDQYVVIDPEEIAKLRKESEKAIDIQGFVDQGQIEPTYYSGKTYYLLPDGPAGHKPYKLLHQTMVEDGLYAVGTAILSAREQVVVIRPVEELLGMTVLAYASKVKKPEQFTGELKDTTLTDAEIQLTRTLVEASKMEDFDIEAFSDGYTEKLQQIIEAKVEGEEIVAVPDVEEPKVINLMEALKASVEQAAGGASKKASSKKASSKKAKAKMAPSTRQRTKRKKKSG
jgi:DNA end-binding protein Ku